MKTDIQISTIVRTVILAIVLINQMLYAMGKSPLPFDNETVEEFVTLTLTIGVTVWAWWKNNSFTKKAIEADKYKNKL